MAEVKLSLCLVEVQFHTFLISALVRDEWSDSCSDCFSAWKELPVPTEQDRKR
jgi:hypothetical protein